MPAVAVAAAASWAGSAVATYIGSTVAISATMTAFIQGTTAFVVSAVGNKLIANDAPSFSDEQTGRLHVVRSSIEPHRIIYGQTIVSGPFQGATNDKTGDPGSGPTSLTVKNSYSAGVTSILLNGYDGVSPLELFEGDTFTIGATTYTLTADAVYDYDLSELSIAFTPALAADVLAGASTSLSYQQAASDNSKKNEYLHMVICLAGHDVQEIGTVYFNELPSTDARFTVDGTPYFRIDKFLGSSTQAASDRLVNAFPGEWTFDHRGRGIAYVYCRLRWNADVWPTGIPNIKAVVKGRKVYDPRTTITAWSNNPALCIRDYLTASFGLGCASTEIDDASFIAAANICDEDVDLNESGSETQKRYTLDGSFDLSQTPQDILAGMLSSCAGILVYQQGKWRLLVGAYRTPGVSDKLDEDDLRGPLAVQAAPSRRDLFNAVRGTYVDPNKMWQPTDFPVVKNNTYATQDGETIYRDIELPFTTDPIRAQRLAKIRLEKSRQGVTVEWPGKLSCLKYRVGDVVKLNVSHLGWVDKDFIVTRWALAPDGGVDLTLQEEAESCYDWNYGNATVVDPAPDTSLPSAFSIEPPTNVTFVESSYIAPGGEQINGVILEWTESTTASVVEYEVQGKEQSEVDWQSFTVKQGTARYDFFPVVAGFTYKARVRAVSILGQKSAWANAADLTVVGYATELPDFTSAQAFFSPDVEGNVHRFKIRMTIDDDPALYPSSLAIFVAADQDPRTVDIVSDEGSRVKINNIGVTWSSAYGTVKSGSNTTQLVIRDPGDNLPTNINLAGRYWAKFGSSEWRKITSYDDDTLYFTTPFDVSPTVGQTVDLVKISWADERSDTWRLVRIRSSGGAYEVARWAGDIDQIGSDFYVNLSHRGLEGTTQVNGTGGSMAYFPAPGAGSRMISLPLISLDRTDGVLTGESEVSFELPATWWISATVVAYRTSATGNVRSNLKFVTYGGPYDAST